MPPTTPAPRETRSLEETLQFPDSIKELDLSSNDALEELPKSIGQLRGLEVLDDSHTSLDRLPRALFKLASLRVLRLGFTKLRGLPDELAGVRGLCELGARSWAMRALPPVIGKLDPEKLDVAVEKWAKDGERIAASRRLRELRLDLRKTKVAKLRESGARDLLPRGGANNRRESANGVGKRRQFFPILSHLSWSSGPW